MRASLKTDLGGGLVLPTPVMVAAGCLRSGRELHGLVDLHKVGGIVTTSVTLEPRMGTPTPRISETPSGVLYSIGLQNPGVDAFIVEELAALRRIGVPIVVSVAGSTIEEYMRVTGALNHVSGLGGIEVNLAVPDAERTGAIFSGRPDRAAEVAGAVARLTQLPVFAKLAAETPDVVDVAGACAHAGVHGVTLISGLPGLAMNLRTGRPDLGSVVGRVAGPAIRPVAVRAVYEVSRALPDLPIMGCGGVRTGSDGIEMLLAGAWAVQVGSAMLVDPAAPVDVARGILRFQRARQLETPADVRAAGRSGP